MKLKFIFFFLFNAFAFAVFSQEKADSTQQKENPKPTSSIKTQWDDYKRFRIGGYGELLYQHLEYGADRYKDPAGATRDNRSYVSLPRAVFAFDYKFRDDIVFSTEVEFEYGGTGAAMELEYEEGGEYEMEIEKAGEVVLEQLHITKRFFKWLNIRLGHFIVPVGLTNAHHEPIFFFGTSRPEGEMTILPCTWHETGIAVLGYLPAGFSYELMVVNGLDPNGFSSINWIMEGKQGIFEKSVMTSPAVAGRVEWAGVKGLRLGASGYFNNTAKNASKPEKMTGIKAPVSIGTFDAQYQTKDLAVRANVVYGHLGDAKRLSAINKTISKNTNFPRTSVAEVALTYSIEAGYNVLSFFKTKQKLMPFVRYEYYNSAEKMAEGMAAMPINRRNVLTVGLNYYLLPNMIVKADYSMRALDSGNYRQENTFGLAVAYTGWFLKK